MTGNGEVTACYISSYLKKLFKDIEIFRLATGLPFNSSIDYIDFLCAKELTRKVVFLDRLASDFINLLLKIYYMKPLKKSELMSIKR